MCLVALMTPGAIAKKGTDESLGDAELSQGEDFWCASLLLLESPKTAGQCGTGVSRGGAQGAHALRETHPSARRH